MTRHIINFIIIFFIYASAQAIEKSASDTAQDFYNLLKHENYSAAATYYDQAALREFRQLMNFENELTAEQKQYYFQEFFEPDLTDTSIDNLSDVDFMAAFLRGVISSERFSQMIDYKNLEIIGEVKEQEDLAHVVARQWISLAGNKMEIIEATSFDKIDGDWKVRMTGKLKGVAVMIRQQFNLQ